MSCNCDKKKTVYVKRLTDHAIMPEYKTEKASGMDLAVPCDVILAPEEKLIIPLDWAIELPPDTEMQIRPRSGTSANTDLMISNSPGTIDEDYRGNVGLIIENKSKTEGIAFLRGERIAQGVIGPVYRCKVVETSILGMTERGEGGYGHTGA